ncbi:MAG: hypothetical protein ACXIT4_08615 [Erythrobacter sp.]
MRTALLAAVKPTPERGLRAGLLLGGRSVLAWQTRIACDLGCERIIVLTDQPDDHAIIEAKQETRRRDQAFLCLEGFTRLPALLSSEDELLIIADGLIPDAGDLHRMLQAPTPNAETTGTDSAPRLQKAVISIPDNHPQATGFPEDFERIDAEKCWAGVLLMRAAPAQQLSQFPPDADAISLLLRMALQAGTPCAMRPQEPSDGTGDQHGWILAHDAARVAAHEQALLRSTRAGAPWSAPGAVLAHHIAAKIGTGAAHRDEVIGALAGLIALIAGAGLAIWGYAWAAMTLAALGSLAFGAASNLAVMRWRLLQISSPRILRLVRDPVGDGLAALVLALALAPPAALDPLAALGALTIGLGRIAGKTPNRLRAGFWQDRSLQLALLAVAGAFGILAGATAILGVLAMIEVLALQTKKNLPTADEI